MTLAPQNLMNSGVERHRYLSYLSCVFRVTIRTTVRNFEVTFDKFVIVRSNEFFTEMKQSDSSIIVLYMQYEEPVQ